LGDLESSPYFCFVLKITVSGVTVNKMDRGYMVPYQPASDMAVSKFYLYCSNDLPRAYGIYKIKQSQGCSKIKVFENAALLPLAHIS
jgi:hypothetical protein